MSGSIRGKIECLHSTGNMDRNPQEIFKNLYDFFVAHPNCTLVARHGGLASNANSIDYWDGANPFLTNAWFVVKMAATGTRAFDYYVLIQWKNYASDFGASPGNPGLVRGVTASYYAVIGIQVAIGIGGDTNPWNGTSGSPWQNTKGSPVWKVPSGGSKVLVFGRSNNPDGSFTSVKQNCSAIHYTTLTTNIREGIVADDDSFTFFTDQGDDLSYYVHNFSLYTPRPGLSLAYPVVALFAEEFQWLAANAWGGVAGTSTRDGGIVHRDFAALGVRDLQIDRLPNLLAATFQPNTMFATPEYDMLPLPVMLGETPHKGVLGHVEWLREIGNVACLDTTPDLKMVFVGDIGTNTVKRVIPWDGATTPRSGVTRAGINFVRAP